MSHSHRAPSIMVQTVWKLSQQQQLGIPEVAMMLLIPPQRVERIIDAMHKRRVERWRML